MFYTDYNTYEGEPVRLYRSPAQIRTDINLIKDKIEMTTDGLNIRNVISELLTEVSLGDPDGWMCQLSDLVSEAEAALSTLKELKENLDGLYRELEDTVWQLGT